MPVSEQKKAVYHPNLRKQVIASADVLIRQVQVVDKKGQVRSVIVWQCGSDMMYANTMDGMFDTSQRRVAPDWLKEQLAALSPDKDYTYSGEAKTVAPVPANTSQSVGHLPEDDEDLPSFVQG